MYKVGDVVFYKTRGISTQNYEHLSQEKQGIITEAFTTIENKPCYWIEGERELILHEQIISAL